MAAIGCFPSSRHVLLMLAATDGDRGRRDKERTKRQADTEVFQASADGTHDSSQNITSGRGEEEAREGSASAFNPENPYHVSTAPAQASVMSALADLFSVP